MSKFKFHNFRWLTVVAIAFLVSCKAKKADMLLINGIVHTVDAKGSVDQAIAIKDGKVIGTGATYDLQFEYKADTIIDLRGKYVYPGFIDAHCHFYGYAMNLNKVDLVGTKSWEEVISIVDSFSLSHPDGWIQGRGWDQNDWSDQDWPDNSLLNERFPDRPVLLRRVDGHAAIANEAALELAGIYKDTRIKGGKILRKGRNLSGVLLDNAVERVDSVIPNPSHDDIVESLKRAEKDLFAVGLTTVDDAGLDLEIIELIDSLQQLGELQIRVYAMANPNETNLDKFLTEGPYKTDRLHVRAFKIYADGALGSRGACLLDTYKDRPEQQGFLMNDPSYYEDIAQRIHEGGFQMNTHCIGDSANRMILRIYAQTLGPDNDERWRVEHSQVVSPTDFQMFSTYNIWPSVQPKHATSDMYWAEDRLGKERVKGAYAYKTLFSQNNMIAFGSDFPVEPINPILGYYAATARKDLTGYPYGGFEMEEALGRDTSLRAMTIWPATANFEENEKGSLEPGKLADLVILENDIVYMELDDLPYVKVLATMVNGEIVHSDGL